MQKNKKFLKCPGCQAIFVEQANLKYPQYTGFNRYGVAIPECHEAFLDILEFEIKNFGYPPAHFLIGDAYAVQHPPHLEYQLKLNISKRLIAASIQSVVIHLVGLYFACEKNEPGSGGSAMNNIWKI